MENVGFAIVHCDIPYDERLAKVLNYFHTFVEENGLLFLRAKIEEIVQDIISSAFLYGMSSWTYRRYVQAENGMLRHPRLLYVVNKLSEKFYPVSPSERLH